MSKVTPVRISGYETTPRFKKLRPALRNWIAIVNEFVRRRGEPPYYYSNYERVNCGLLSAALWQARIPNLHEVAVERRGKEPLGRADLDLWLGDTEYFIEAKMCWLNLGDFLDADSIEKELGGRLVRASKDSRKYLFGPEDRWIAMVFVVPRIPKKLWRKPGEPERSLREFVRAVQSEHLGADMVAWTLPRGFKRWKRCIGDVDSAYFPAVALVGKRAPTRKAR